MGTGAYSFAASTGLYLSSPRDMVTSTAQDEWKNWIAKYEASRNDGTDYLARGVIGNVQDTVGAVACDCQGDLASGVSRYCPPPPGRWHRPSDPF